MATNEKMKAIAAAMGEIEKQFGKGSIMMFGDKAVNVVPSIPTGAINLDLAIGVGGIPRGRVVELYGPESSGKSTLCLSIVAQAQKAGGIAAYVDAEHAMDPAYATNCGVNIDDLLISQPDCGEQALQIVETLVKSGAVDLIIVDSVAALTPRAELDGDMGDASMGMQARLMGQALRKLTAIMAKSNTTVIFINQLREKIGVMFGSPETTPGGKALKFYASIRIDIRRVESIKNGTEVIGNRVKVKLVKNKCAPPFREAQFDIMFGKGINGLGALLDVAVDRAIVEKSGTWFSYKSERIGQGREQSQTWLGEHRDALAAIDAAIRIPAVPSATVADAKAVVEAPKVAKEKKSDVPK